MIAFFDGLYYLYGTSYNCGYQWGVGGAPCCGFKTYSSPDLVHWTDRGPLFDASTTTWQTRCNGSTYGCYRPHVIYNEKTHLYVLWINVYDNRVGFRVFTSPDPIGPFFEVAIPTLAINSSADSAGLNNGDHDLFVDDDGTAYLAFTDWKTGGRIAIERLNETYQSGTGDYIAGVTPGNTEAPALFKRRGTYYVTYSDPNCGYCGGTGTSYRTATSPLGPWSEGTKISTNSCGGQPSFVSPIRLENDTAFLYGSDLWNNAEKNEALANYYWAPLSFGADGSILPMECQKTVTLTLAEGAQGSLESQTDLDANAGVEGFLRYCDITAQYNRAQSFIPSRSGRLTSVSFTSFQHGNPDAGLLIDVFCANEQHQPIGVPLFSAAVPVDSIGWSPRNVTVTPGIEVTSGTRYTVVIKSATTTGCYGLAYNDNAPYAGGGAAYSSDSGKTFTAETNRTLKFQTTVTGDEVGVLPPRGFSKVNSRVNPRITVRFTASSRAIVVNAPERSEYVLKLINVMGRTMVESKGKGTQCFAVNAIRPGLYVALLSSGQMQVQRKVVLH
jgi:hypothetical protein